MFHSYTDSWVAETRGWNGRLGYSRDFDIFLKRGKLWGRKKHSGTRGRQSLEPSSSSQFSRAGCAAGQSWKFSAGHGLCVLQSSAGQFCSLGRPWASHCENLCPVSWTQSSTFKTQTFGLLHLKITYFFDFTLAHLFPLSPAQAASFALHSNSNSCRSCLLCWAVRSLPCPHVGFPHTKNKSHTSLLHWPRLLHHSSCQQSSSATD